MIKKIIRKYFNIPLNFYTEPNKYLIIATFFGCGYFKKAPGTFASFVALLMGIAIGAISSALLTIITTLLMLVGFFVSEQITSTQANKDPSYIVIDEVVGMLLALLLANNNLFLSLLCFIIFRILDIKKPWLIGAAEHHFHGGTAVMMDDIIAGFATLLIVALISAFII